MRFKLPYLRHLTMLLVCLIWHAYGVQAQENEPLVTDAPEISLLTCSPGTEIYEIYGHSALRVKHSAKGYDYVFNYGVFSFNQPNFALNFVLGKCDYMCEFFPYEYFEEEYRLRGSSITEQRLNLTPDEANRLFANLVNNCRPENRVYRYNFILCNCTTRVLDMIEGAIDGEIEHAPAAREETYREILHHYTKGYDWYEAGNDLLLGCSMDTIVTQRATLFAPERMMLYADSAFVVSPNGKRRALVSQSRVILPKGEQKYEAPFPLSPYMTMTVFVGLLLVVACIEWHTGRMLWGTDVVLMTIQGVVGLLVAFVFFFSQHPGVNSNWQIWVLNPLPLLCLPWVVCCAVKRKKCYYHVANFVVLTLFMIFSVVCQQDLCDIIVPLTFGLLTRPVSYAIQGYWPIRFKQK